MQRIIPLIKNVLLLALVALVFIDNFVYSWFVYNAGIIIYCCMGLYLFLTLVELFLNVRSVREQTALSFKYLTKFFIFKKIVINAILLALGIVSFMSYSKGAALTMFAFALFAVDLVSFIARNVIGYYRLMIETFTFSIVEDQEKVVHSARVDKVEFRYDVFFFKMKDGKVKEIDLMSLQAHRQKEFVREMTAWIRKHNIPISTEGEEKLQAWK
jgi:hypothetical protein